MPALDDAGDGRRLALVIATSTYSDPTLQKLRAPGRDAAEFADVLSDRNLGGFEVLPLVDQTSDRVQRKIAEFCAEGGPADLALIYFSCHGVMDDRNRLYYATTNTERQWLSVTAISAQWLNDHLEDCRCRRQLLILDCCHSGAFAKGAKGDAALALKDRFEARGRAVLTASRATEYSFEGDRVLGEGTTSWFTDALIEGIRSGQADGDKDGRITVTELYDYSYAHVKTREARQTPGLWMDAAEGKLLVAQSPLGAIIEAAPLPEHIQLAIESPSRNVRQAAVEDIARLLNGPNAGVAVTARATLEHIAEEDAPRVAAAARAVLEEQTRRDAEEQARRDAEEQARRDAEEQARRETEEQARRDAEEQARRETEEQARRDAEEQARRDADEQARREADEQARREAKEQARREAEAARTKAPDSRVAAPGPMSERTTSGARDTRPTDAPPRPIRAGGSSSRIALVERSKGRLALILGAGLVLGLFAAALLIAGKSSDSAPDRARAISVGDGPEGVAVGAGAVWVVNSDDNTVSRIDPARNRTGGEPIPVGDGPGPVAVGAGAVWVTNSDDNTVSRIDPARNRTVGEPIPVGDGPRGVAVGAGAVWVVNAGDDTVSRIDPARNRTVGEPIPVGDGPEGVAVGASAVWVTNLDDSTVSRINPARNRTVGEPIPVGDGPRGVAAGAGPVWVVNTGDNTVSRIDPARNRTVGEPIPVGDLPKGVAVGADAVWVVNVGDDTVSRIDPARNRTVGEPIPVGGLPQGVAVGAGAVWVTNPVDNTVSRIDPRSN